MVGNFSGELLKRYDDNYDYNYTNWGTGSYIVGGIQVVLGTFLNLWLLVAILTCPTMRQRMRNKLICNLSVGLSLESMITLPVDLVLKFPYRSVRDHYCISVITHLQLTHDFISSWMVVIILVFYLADILDYDPSKRLTALSLRLATTGVLLLPWVGSLITVSSIMMIDYCTKSKYVILDCLSHTNWSHTVFKVIDTIIPVLTSIILITRAIISRRRRFAFGREMNKEVLSPSREIDSPWAYIAMVAAVITCQFLTILHIFDVVTSNWDAGYKYYYLALYVDSTRVILLPLSCFLLSDFRRRLLTWRPWKRPTPGIDLTVAYENDKS